MAQRPRDTAQSLVLDAIAAIEHVVSLPFLKLLSPLSIERGYVIHWKDKTVLPLVGYTDLVYGDVLGNSILDWKTGSWPKGESALGMDLAQVAYAFGASADLGLPINQLAYGSICWEAPTGDEPAATVVFALQTIPMDPSRITRLFARCVEASADLRDERFRMGDSETICPTCPFRAPCSQRFGTLDESIVNSAGFALERIASKSVSASTSKKALLFDDNYNPDGPSEKQRTWITQMLQQSDLTVGEAMAQAGLRSVARVSDIPKAQASKLIDFLKPVSERAVKVRDLQRRIDRQVAQTQAILTSLSPDALQDVFLECAISSVLDVTTNNVTQVMKSVARQYRIDGLQPGMPSKTSTI